MVSPAQLGTGDSFRSILGLSTSLLWMSDIIAGPDPWPGKRKRLLAEPTASSPHSLFSSAQAEVKARDVRPRRRAPRARGPGPGEVACSAPLGQRVLLASSHIAVFQAVPPRSARSQAPFPELKL